MRSDVIIGEYTEKINQLILWKRAKPVIKAELDTYISDQAAVSVSKGIDENEATKLAVGALSDTEGIAKLLNASYKPKPPWLLFVVTISLFICGIILRFTVANALGKNLTTSDYTGIFVALIALFGGYLFNITYMKKYPKQAFAGFVLLYALLLLISPIVNGKHIFTMFGGKLNLDLVSLLFPIFFVSLLFTLRSKRYVGIVLSSAGYLATAVVTMFIPSISGITLVTVSSALMMCVAICMRWFGVEKLKGKLVVLATVLVTSSIFGVQVMLDPYLNRRFALIFNPAVDTVGGYQAISIRTLITSSQFLGSATLPPGSESAASFVDKFNGEYLLTYLIYNYGFIIFFAILLTLAAFLTIAIVFCVKQKSFIGKMTSLAVISSFGIQAIFYIAKNLGINFGTSMSLPLLSNDNVSLVINMLLIGVMLSGLRHEVLLKNSSNNSEDRKPLFCYNDEGARIVNPHR